MPQDEIPLQLGAAQVQVPVSQAKLFGGELLAAAPARPEWPASRGPHDLKR